MNRKTLAVVLLLAALAASAASTATYKTVWQDEVEEVSWEGSMRYGTSLVDDAQASGGKAVRVPFDPTSANNWNFIHAGGEVELQGGCPYTVWVRAENASPLADRLVVTVVAHNKTTGQWDFHREWPIYGANLKPEGYTPIRIVMPTAIAPETYRLEVIFLVATEYPDSKAAFLVDRAELATEIPDAPELTGVTAARVRYEPGQTATVEIGLRNPLAKEAEVTLLGEELSGLAAQRQVFEKKATLPAAGEQRLTAEWALGKEEYGREIRVRLLYGGKEVGQASDVFGVSRHPLWVATGNAGDAAFFEPGGHYFYVGPAALQESRAWILKSRKYHRTYFEFFSWSPGDIADQDPSEEVFPGGEGRITYRSKWLIQEQNKVLRQVGMWPVTYVNGTAWAMAGYLLFQQHPEWFLYDANGEVAHYEMDSREKYRDKDDFAFDPNTYPSVFFQGVLNHSLPEVQEYVARQYINCGKDMGFAGVRMDVRYLEVYPGERDFSGKEVAPTWAEADRISAASVKNVKRLVHEAIPDFTFGYNYAAPEEVANMMATFKERCEGGAWMLDEIPCTYQEKTSPYHLWQPYVRRMTSWGDSVRKWGGVYNPYDFRRGDLKYAVDKIYSTLIRLICGGHPYGGHYYNSRLPMGDPGGLSTRYSELLYGKNLDWLGEIKGEVDVKSAAALWWRDMVYWNRTEEGKRQLIVHLLNPPAAPEVEENPQSKLSPPVRGIEVTCAPADGQAPSAAYLVASEPEEPWGENQTRALRLELRKVAGGRVAVTVPSVIIWKTVVFQW